MHVMSVCLGSVQTGFVYTADMAAGYFDVVLDPCCVLIIFQLCFYTFKLLPGESLLRFMWDNAEMF